MRMRDWSSDVCSSDLRQRRHDAYPDGAVSATQARSHLCYRLPELLGAECCLSDEQSAGRSWPRSRAAPLEQRYAKPSFQQLHPALACRLRYVKCSQIGRAHDCTTVTNAQLVSRLMLDNKKYIQRIT